MSNLDEEHRQKNGVENVASATGEGATGNSSIEDKDARKSGSQKNTPRKKYLSVQGALSSSPAVKSLFGSSTGEKDDTLENKLLQPTARVRVTRNLTLRNAGLGVELPTVTNGKGESSQKPVPALCSPKYCSLFNVVLSSLFIVVLSSRAS